MKAENNVIEHLNRALTAELTAVHQFWLHSRLQHDWGLGSMAARSLVERDEEMQHADRLIDRIIFLEGIPDLQSLHALRIGKTPRETLECDLAVEHDARAYYRESREYCRDAGDYVSMGIFEALLADEEEHIDFLETQLDLINRIGEERYAQLNATPMDAAGGA